MEDLFYRFVERLRQDPSSFSRNRNFHTFEDEPRFFLARQVHRRLLSFEGNLASAEANSITVEPTPGGYKVSFFHAATKSQHVAFLNHQEHQLLLSNPNTRQLLTQGSVASSQ
jgi:hypothetical protein